MKSMRAITLELLLVTGLTVMGCSSEMFNWGDTGWITLLDGSNPKDPGQLEPDWRRQLASRRRRDRGRQRKRWPSGLEELLQRFPNSRRGLGGSHYQQRHLFSSFRSKAIGSKTAYEANIYDQRPEPEYGTGAIVNVSKVSPMPKAGGKWNTLEITAKGSHLTVVLNDTKTVDVQHAQFAEGPISLQFGNREKGAPGGAIKWRRVQIRPL